MITKVTHAGMVLSKLSRVACITGPNGSGKTRLLGAVFRGISQAHAGVPVEGAARLEGREPGGREWTAGSASGLFLVNKAKIDNAIAVIRDEGNTTARLLARTPVNPQGQRPHPREPRMRDPQLDWQQSCALTGTPTRLMETPHGPGVISQGIAQSTMLQLVSAMRAADVVLADDIDQHFSPATLRHMVPAVRDQLGAQLICSTHNPLLVGLLDPDEVWVMERRGEGMEARSGIARLSDHPACPQFERPRPRGLEWDLAQFWEKSLIEPWVCDLPGSGEATN